MRSQGSRVTAWSWEVLSGGQNSKFFLIIITIFKLLISAPAPPKHPLLALVGNGNEGKVDIWLFL